jgi:hypothetical protein
MEDIFASPTLEELLERTIATFMILLNKAQEEIELLTSTAPDNFTLDKVYKTQEGLIDIYIRIEDLKTITNSLIKSVFPSTVEDNQR